jgi:hypothetical protein
MPLKITQRERQIARSMLCLDWETRLDWVVRQLAQSPNLRATRKLYNIGWLCAHPEYIDGGAL